MTLAFNSLQKKTIQQVLEWYQFQEELLGREKSLVVEAALAGTVARSSRFYGRTRQQVESFFEVQRNELDLLAMLDLMAAAEASLRLDYRDRVNRRSKDRVSRRFREIDRDLTKLKMKEKVILEDHILDTWKDLAPKTARPIGEFKGAVKLRDWLAHGRYWDPKLGRRQYTPSVIYDISANLLVAIQ